MPVDDEHYAAELHASLTHLGLEHHEAEHILHNNDDHQTVLSGLLMCASFDGVPQRDLPDFIRKILALDAASHWVAIAMLTSHVLVMRAAISAGMQNKGVRRFGNLVLDTASGQFHLNGHQRRLIQTLIFQFGVTVAKLRAANATPHGCMGVFTPPIRALIKRTMPTVPALLDHVLAKVDSRAAAQITASRKRKRVLAKDPGVIEEPDHAQLLCHENIADLAPECSTDRPDGKTASAYHEEASGYTTPPPTKMSKREIRRLNCAPLKMPRLD